MPSSWLLSEWFCLSRGGASAQASRARCEVMASQNRQVVMLDEQDIAHHEVATNDKTRRVTRTMFSS